MAIAKISCPQCKKSFKGRDDLEGKRIRCPGCGFAFVVEKYANAEDAAAALLMAEESGPTHAKPAAVVDDEDDDPNPFGVKSIKIGARCPNCANEMASEDAVICLFCGYNVQTRKLGKTKKVIATTGVDFAQWSTPGILAAASIFLIYLLHLLNVFWLPVISNHSDAWYWEMLCSEPVRLWGSFIGLGCIWAAGRYAFKRLVVEPKPPELELD